MNNETITQNTRLGIKELSESITANIRAILLTSRGEVPFRPGFGLGAERLLGGGMKDIDLVYEVVSQLSTYEKRIRVKTVSQIQQGGHRTVKIVYRILSTSESKEIFINN